MDFEEYIAKNGQLVYTNVGTSMLPLLREKRDLVIIGAKPAGRLKRYDVPLYRRENGQYVLHRILKVRKEDYVLCGDNRWQRESGVTDGQIIGVLKAVVRDGHTISINENKYILYVHLICDLYPIRVAVLWVRDMLKRMLSKLSKPSAIIHFLL